jgi:hypothetical protein
VLTALVLAATAGAASAAAAEDPRATDGASGTVVMLGELDQGAEVRKIVRAVEGQLADLDVRLHVVWREGLPGELPDQIDVAEQVAREVGALAVFWCDRGHSDRIFLYFAAPQGGRMVARELTGSGPGGAVEALAIIVRSTVEAVLDGGEIGVVVAPGADRDQAASSTAREATTARAIEERRNRLALDAAYELTIRSNAYPTDHGVWLGLRLQLGALLHCGLGYTIAFPTAVRAWGAELELRHHPAQAWVGWGRLVGVVRLVLSLGLRIDPVTERIGANAAGVRVNERGHEVIFSALPTARASYLVGERMELFVSFGVELPFNDVRYVLDGPDGPLVVRDDWAVRPRALVGLAALLW